MAVTLFCVQGRKDKEDYRKDVAVRIGLEKEKRETEDSKRVKRTFRFYLVCGRSKCAVLQKKCKLFNDINIISQLTKSLE